MKDIVYVDKRDYGIAFLVLNRPETKNALNGPLMDLLSDTLLKLDADDEVRAIILKGEGENFSSGGDLKQSGPEGMTVEKRRKLLKKYLRTVQTIQQIGTPVIAMVDGFAIGGAMSLALACDIIYASDRVKFIPNFLKLGIVPEMGAMMFLPQLLGPYRAKELFFSGRVVGAKEGYKLGFVNEIFPANELEEGTLSLAKEIAARPATALQITKCIINSSMSTMLNLVLATESTASPFCTQTEEFQEIIAKFTKK